MTLQETFEKNSEYWIKIMQSEEPFTVETPENILLKDIQKLNFIKILAKEKMISSIIIYIK